MAVSAGLGALSSVIGLYVSYYANVASGSAIVLTATAIFLLAFLLSPRRGLIRQWLARSEKKHAR